MSTPINQISEKYNDDDDEMPEDDNKMVSEILEEMQTNDDKQYEHANSNKDSFMNDQQQMYEQSQEHQLQRQFDPLVNMPAHDSIQEENYNLVQNIEPIKEKTLIEKIVNKLKDPSIVFFCAFIFNNLFTNSIIKKYLPLRFTNMPSKINIFAVDIVKGILIALLFFAIKTIL